jgi:hypothetical protein
MNSKRDKLMKAIEAAQALLLRKSRKNFKQFVKYLKGDYDMQWFHAYICMKLNAFAEGDIKKLMILLPPQHGKSELATRLFPPYLLGRNPDLKIAIASYADSIASGFNRAIQRNLDNEAYGKTFPDTQLNYSKIFGTNYDNYSRTEHKFEIVQKKGSLKTVGRGGSLTSEPVDIGIIDDLYKDREEAKSLTISESCWSWYVDVFRTRLHNDSQQLIMNTRWDENDLCGRLLIEEPGEWEVIKFPAIRTEDINDYDTRQEGEVLWPQKHSLEKVLSQKKLSQVSYNSLYQQDPKPNTDILIYSNWVSTPQWAEAIETVTWGLDFGKTTGINALVKSGVVGDNVYFKECLYAPSVPMSEVKNILVANGYKEGQIVYCDHMPGKIAELRILGVSAFPALKGDGSIDAGITKLKEYTCHYMEDSVNIKMELNNYQWVCYGKIITNIPVDEFNHLLDACRYAVYSRYFRGR